MAHDETIAAPIVTTPLLLFPLLLFALGRGEVCGVGSVANDVSSDPFDKWLLLDHVSYARRGRQSVSI